MQKDKCVICTIGTSIANGCELQLEYFNPGHAWEEDTKIFEQQINLRVTGLKNTIHKISAEINSLERLGLSTMSTAPVQCISCVPWAISSKYNSRN